MDYVEFGTVGGFTGGKDSRKIYSDGRLVHVTKILYSSPEVETTIRNLELETVNKIFKLFTSDVLSKSYNKPNNMSLVLTYKCGNKVYSWVYPFDDDDDEPAFLKTIVDELNKLK